MGKREMFSAGRRMERQTDRQSETGVRDGDGDGHRPGLLLFKLASLDYVL